MEPSINQDEFIGKTVGRRRAPNPLRIVGDEIAESKAWRAALGGIRVPRGVYRFKTHEEANEWMMKHLTQRAS